MSLPYLQPYLGLSNGLNTIHAAGAAGGAWDYDHDFSTDDGNWGFANGGANEKVDTASSKLLFYMQATNTGSTNHAVTGDLTGSTWDDTAWIYRIHGLRFDTITAPAYFFLGAGASNYSTNTLLIPTGPNEDWMGWRVYTNFANYTGYLDGTSENYSSGSTHTLSTSTDYYVEAIRTSATTQTFEWGTDNTFATFVYSGSHSVASTTNNIRYIKLANSIYTGFGGLWDGQFDRVQWADGVTTAP